MPSVRLSSVTKKVSMETSYRRNYIRNTHNYIRKSDTGVNVVEIILQSHAFQHCYNWYGTSYNCNYTSYRKNRDVYHIFPRNVKIKVGQIWIIW